MPACCSRPRAAHVRARLPNIRSGGSMPLRSSVLVLILSSFANAQSNGRITGSVADPSGAAVPRARVNLLLHGGQRPLLATATTAQGLFVLESVRPELYDLTVEA